LGATKYYIALLLSFPLYSNSTKILLFSEVSFSGNDSLRFQLKVGNRIIVPMYSSYTEKLVCKSLHCFQGNFAVKNKTSFFNPFIEFSRDYRLRKNKKYELGLIFGFQYLQLENTKVGEYTNYSLSPAGGYFKGTIVNISNEYSTYFAFQPSYMLFSDNVFNVKFKINVRVDYPIQGHYYQKTNGIDNYSNVVNTSSEYTKLQAEDLSFYLISFSSLESCYSLTKRVMVSIEFSVPIFFLNDIFDDEATDPFSNYYNNPRYIQNYRSSINHINYLTFNSSLIYKF